MTIPAFPPRAARIAALASLLTSMLLPYATATAQIPFKARIDSIQAFLRSPDAPPTYYSALERLRHDSTRAAGIAMFESVTRMPTSEIIDRFRLTAAWLFIRAALPDSLSARVKNAWYLLPTQPPSSEAERVCHHVSFLLAAEHFGLSQEWYNGRSTAENRRESAAFLRRWIKETTELGQQDFDSPTYGPLFINGMLLLARFTSDPDLRKQAELMVSWLLADAMHEYFGGQLGGAHSREDMNSAMQPLFSEMSAFAWLYFGDGPQMYTREQYLATLCSYRPPKEIVALAVDKFTPFEAWESKRSATRVRGDTAPWRIVAKYTYFDPLYVMGHLERGLVQPREQHSWDVTWSSDQTSTTLFTMQPYAEADGLAEFLPQPPETVLRAVSLVDPYYGTVTKTVGGSPFEDIFQYRNTVIALYDIPEIKRFPYLVGFLPSEVKTFEVDSVKTGWITIDAGDVYLAYYPLRQAVVRVEALGRRLFSRDRKNGAVVQAAGRNAVGSYADFKKRILASVPDTSGFFAKGRVRYTTIFKDKLDCAFGGKLTVNRKPLRPKPEMLFDSPWLSSKRGSGVLRITTPKGALVIDMPARALRNE
ncbi:MAG: hypothetical protein IPP94_17690 [Ignavibacteria bacterium]|nr:hypothetical protein [Ignavibacteria bacterium]